MAKKQVQVIEIDVITKGLDTAQNSFKSMSDAGGELGKKSKEILKDIEKARAIMEEYGDEIPISKAKELQKILERISGSADDISQMDNIKIFGDKELEKIKKINSQLEEYNNKIKEQKKLQKELSKKRDDRIEKLKTQKTANLTQDDGSKKSVKLDSIQGKWNTKDDLTKLSASGTVEQQEAAKAVLEQITKAQEQYNKALEESNDKITNYGTAIVDLRKAKAEVATTTRELTDAEKLAGESTAMFAQTQATALNKVIQSNQKLGNSAIDTSNKLKKQQTSLGRVVQSLFSWTAAWNLGKKLYREAVHTINEMDEALTGMAMVTSKSRDEVDLLIPRIQNLAKETSTAMTEIAGLITEYTKQGRTLEESFILAEETAKAAKIAGISAAESIQYMTSAINGFNLAAKDATRVSDVFANLAAISATDYEQLAIALSKVSAQANLAGMSMEFTTSLLAKGIETTQEAPESIGTALKTIVARMRELSDYGSTLEDGASVNRVESALASAGIQLRDVNGEFRDLEEIFNELGPQWDKLNTMQQQAIAQAVAGTRQQSRFVAIMQDWERTQELAAEAQDSAGASAAQYAVYAKGMEAAMTNVKTAWQEFTQSLTSSKIIIGLINTITKALDGITNFLEGGGELTKVIFLGISGIVMANKVLTPLRKALGMETDKEKLLEIQKLDILRKQAIEHEKLLKQKHEEAKLAAQEAENNLQEATGRVQKAENRVTNAKQAVLDRESEINTHNANYGDDGQFIDPATDPILLSLQQQVIKEEEILAKVKEQVDIKRNELASANEMVTQTAEQVRTAEEGTKKAAEGYRDALEQTNTPLSQRMQMNINILNNEREKLKLAQMQAKSEKERAKLKKQEEQLTQRIISLENKKQKVLTKTNGLFSRMSMTISTSITSGLQSVFSYLGPIGDLLNAGLTSLINWTAETLAAAAAEFALARAKKSSNKEDNKGADSKKAKLGLTAAEAVTEKVIEETKEEQTEEEKEETAAKLVGTAATGGEAAAEAGELAVKKKNTAEEKKGLGAKITSAIVGAAKSAAEIPVAGWIIALTLLAAAGIAVAASTANIQKADKKTEGKIGENQNTLYKAKQQNAEIDEKKDRLTELTSKKNRTSEEERELQELTSSIQEMDESFKNREGADLIEAMNRKQVFNDATIKRETDASYQLALAMNDLGKSVMGRQAVENKIISSQKELIASNERLAGANQEVVNSVTEKTSAMAESFANNIGELSLSKNTTHGDDWADVGATVGLSMINPLFGAIYSIGNAVVEKSADNERQKALNGYIEEFTKKSVDFVTDMEMVIGETDKNGELVNGLGTQVRAYMDKIDLYVDANDDFMRKQFAAQYETLDFIASLGDNSKDEETAQAFRNQVLNNIDELTKFGTITTQNIEALAKVFSDLEEKKENYREADKIIAQSDLINVAKDFGLSGDASAEKLLSTALGSVNIDKNGNYSRHWSNKNENNAYKFGSADGSVDPTNYTDAYLTNIVNNVLPKLQELGLGDVGFKAIQDYAYYSQNFDPEQMFADYTSTLLSTIQKSSGDIAKDVYAAQQNSSVQGYIDTSKALATQAKKKMEQAQASNDYEALKQARDEYNTYMEDINTLEQQLLNVTRDMAGYMTSSELNEFVTRINSTAEKLDDLREKASSTEAFDTDQFDRIQNDIIPLLQKELGDAFDASKFVTDLQNGSVEGFKLLNEYEKLATEANRQELKNNVSAHAEEIKRLEESLKLVSESEKDSIRSQINAEKAALAIAKTQLDNYEKNLDVVAGLTAEERKRLNLENKLQALEDDDSLTALKERIRLTKELNKENSTAIDDKYDEILKGFGKGSSMTKEMLRNIIKVENGAVVLGDAYETLADEEKQYIDSITEGLKEVVSSVEESEKKLQELTNSWYEKQIDQQSKLLDAYKSQLESEQESLQDSLDQRKKMYEKYFDSLDNETEQEDFKEQQAFLQRAIAALSGATDATSLNKRKEYEQQLKDLEKERLQSDREARKENALSHLDNQSESIDQYYAERLKNESALWTDIRKMSSEEITNLMTTYNEEYKYATDLNKAYMLSSYKQLHADILTMMGNTDAAAKATADYENYKRWMEKYADDPTIGNYDPTKAYSKGGIVDYTGLAMVHGTPSQPEAFLNHSQTELFMQLAQGLEYFYTRPHGIRDDKINTPSNSVTIDNFTIAIDATLTDNNVQKTGYSLADALLDGLRRNGISTNMRQ